MPVRLAEGESSPLPYDLQTIIDHWPDLPDAVKAGIVAMVRASCVAKLGTRCAGNTSTLPNGVFGRGFARPARLH